MVGKDAVSDVISAIALIVSAVAFFVTFIRGRHERAQNLRLRLDGVIKEMMSLTVENAKLFHEEGVKDRAYYEQVSGALTQHMTALAQEAIFLTKQIPRLVSSQHYQAIAFGSMVIGDALTARDSYQRAVVKAPSGIYKVLALRAYASFLFTQRQFEEGRNQFRLCELPGADTFSRYTNGVTYQDWAIVELNFANSPRDAEDCINKARTEFEGITVKSMREDSLNTLNLLWARATAQPVFRGAAPSAGPQLWPPSKPPPGQPPPGPPDAA